jgi:hypothetical protein
VVPDVCRGIPFPAGNAIGYRELFAVEQWLRRLAHLALNAAVGPAIQGALPPDLYAELKKRRSQLEASAYLGVAAEPDDLIWLTTMDELRAVLGLDSVRPIVKRISGLHASLIDSKLAELREIRNAVGHNRPLSAKTCSILEAAVLSLENGLARLRDQVIARPDTRSAAGDLSDSSLASLLQAVIANHGDIAIGAERLVLSDDDFFHHASLLPRHAVGGGQAGVAELGEWIDAQRLIQITRSIRPTLVATLLPIRGTSLELVWSRKATSTQHAAILQAFVDIADRVWGDLAYDSQDDAIYRESRVWFMF